ncbi:hypothetical protein ACQP1P_39955 [Dactylosporangium sp. CA-052675]|uniref:hypothetical protein n=1 Tax=Dactylosporangium sp. CA-052675 TaxID=3239927 RepID=UPI003D90146B
MSENSSWWLLLPCGIVTVALTTAIVVTVVVVFRKGPRAGAHNRGGDGYTPAPSPLDPTWPSGPAAMTSPDPSTGSSSHEHWQSHGHTIHHHDSGSSSSWSDSGSPGGSDSGSSHHHHSD